MGCIPKRQLMNPCRDIRNYRWLFPPRWGFPLCRNGVSQNGHMRRELWCPSLYSHVAILWHNAPFDPKFPSASFLRHLTLPASAGASHHKIEALFTAASFIVEPHGVKMETLFRTIPSLTVWSRAKSSLNGTRRGMQSLRHLYIMAVGQDLAHSLDPARLLRFSV